MDAHEKVALRIALVVGLAAAVMLLRLAGLDVSLAELERLGLDLVR